METNQEVSSDYWHWAVCLPPDKAGCNKNISRTPKRKFVLSAYCFGICSIFLCNPNIKMVCNSKKAEDKDSF